MKLWLWSASNNAFFEPEQRERFEQAKWDLSDVVEVQESLFAEFTTPPAGKVRVVVNGMPAWADIPPPSADELAAAATRNIASLRAEADAFIAPLKDALDGGYIVDEDKLVLAEWQKYRYALTKVNPAKPVWPVKPE
ncbi:tail fiber assembly protein [Citrobacter portucalensis]|uniref:tail fiber assembly protein n=1 Tax=Citrobacter portucalensis TaxID=1639133 RepID=UPI003A888AED